MGLHLPTDITPTTTLRPTAWPDGRCSPRGRVGLPLPGKGGRDGRRSARLGAGGGAAPERSRGVRQPRPGRMEYEYMKARGR